MPWRVYMVRFIVPEWGLALEKLRWTQRANCMVLQADGPDAIIVAHQSTLEMLIYDTHYSLDAHKRTHAHTHTGNWHLHKNTTLEKQMHMGNIQ